MIILKYLWKFCNLIFPPLQIWRTNRAINQEKIISEYKQKVEEDIENSDRDFESLVEIVENSHKSELDRNTHLDSKAGNYLANLGVVLSILSLGPIFSVALGFEQKSINIEIWPDGVLLLIFVFAVISLLGSAFYSSKAMKMRGYSVYFAADQIQNRLNKNATNKKYKIKELLICKKKNELLNRNKNNLISVAEEFSRNGLISLSLGIVGIIMVIFPINFTKLAKILITSIFCAF